MIRVQRQQARLFRVPAWCKRSIRRMGLRSRSLCRPEPPSNRMQLGRSPDECSELRSVNPRFRQARRDGLSLARLAMTGLLLCVGVQSCADDTRDAVDAARDWPDNLAQFRTHSAIYAPSFLSEPPDGKILRVSLHATSSADACAIYGGRDLETEEQFVRITTNAYRAGRFEIGIDTADAHAPATARFIRAKGTTKTAAYPASAGFIEVSSLPDTLEEWHNGQSIEISGTLQFSRDPVIANECRLEGPANQSAPLTGSCACTHASGETTECAIDPMAGTSNCCESKPPFDVEFQVKTHATRCPEICVVTDPSLGRYCEELR